MPLSFTSETGILGVFGEVEGILVMPSNVDLGVLVEDMADGSVAEGSVGRVIEVSEERLVQNELGSEEGVIRGDDGVLFELIVVVVVGSSTLVRGAGNVLAEVLVDADLGPGGNGVADLFMVNLEVGHLDNWLNLVNLITGADDVLKIEKKI